MSILFSIISYYSFYFFLMLFKWSLVHKKRSLDLFISCLWCHSNDTISATAVASFCSCLKIGTSVYIWGVIKTMETVVRPVRTWAMCFDQSLHATRKDATCSLWSALESCKFLVHEILLASDRRYFCLLSKMPDLACSQLLIYNSCDATCWSYVHIDFSKSKQVSIFLSFWEKSELSQINNANFPEKRINLLKFVKRVRMCKWDQQVQHYQLWLCIKIQIESAFIAKLSFTIM